MLAKRIIVLTLVFLFGAFISNSWARTTILNVPGLGKVIADPGSRQLIFKCACGRDKSCPMEYSILSGNHYMQSEASGWAKPEFYPCVKRERMPHYRTFIVTIARYSKIGVAICRENDGVIGCKVIK